MVSALDIAMFLILDSLAFYKNFVKNASNCLLLLAEVQMDSFEVGSGQSASYFDV